jgi:broad specificity phosphatase PhoE
METKFLLIRHASVDPIGKLIAGRRHGVHLNEKGRSEAEHLIERLMNTALTAIYSSPIERAEETARPIAAARNLRVLIREEFTEIDFGDWTGKTFMELAHMAEWIQFNRCRSAGRIPGGESMRDVRDRMVKGLESVQRDHPAGTVAVFSHCDPIRTALVHFAGMSIDNMLRLTISPASISAVDVKACDAQILALNHVCGRFHIS